MLRLHSEQLENAFLLLLLGMFSIGLAMFGDRLVKFEVPEASLVNASKKIVSFALSPEPKVNPIQEQQTKSEAPHQPKPAENGSEVPRQQKLSANDSTNNGIQQVANRSRDEVQTLSAMFSSNLEGSGKVVVATPSSSIKSVSKVTHEQGATSSHNDQSYEVESQQVVNQTLVKARVRPPTLKAYKTSSSTLLNREIASESGLVDQDIAGLFSDVNQELRRIVRAYGLRKQKLSVTLHFSRGLIGKVLVNKGSVAFKRELSSLLIGQKIATPYTGVKSHLVIIN